MKDPLLLLLLLLGTVAAFHPGKPPLPISPTFLFSPLSCTFFLPHGEGDSALTPEVIQSEEEEAKPSSYWDTFQDEEAMDSDPAALDKDLQCPKEEDIVQIPGSPGCKTCRFLLVRNPERFKNAQNVCRRCYRGSLISIHNYNLDYCILCTARGVNQGQVWIGGRLSGSFLHRRFRWVDGSRWNFGFWAPGQRVYGRGNCVALRTRGGHWKWTPCKRRLPFVCSF
uniref:Proteoglycan 3, pro eosinophil major basic protein 2 n=1 Tax=Canis lupus dingo TaxID=286419 RepID=A0A8C0QT09_CANLU